MDKHGATGGARRNKGSMGASSAAGKFRPGNYGGFLLLSLLLLLGWEAVARLGLVPAFILPAPSRILLALAEHHKLLLGKHLPATLGEVTLGLGLSVAVGILLGVGMHAFRPLEKTLYPMVIVSQTVPLIALSPILILWFGYGIWSKVAVVFLISFFPIVVGVYDGLKKGGQAYSELLLSMGASRRDLLLKVRVPLALPSFLSSLKLAAVYSVVGATIGEWLGGNEGLGYFSRRTAGNLQTDAMFAAILLLSLLGIALFILVSAVEIIVRKKKRGLY